MLEKELHGKTAECTKLTHSLAQVGQKSSDVLEMALSDNIEKLQGELAELQQKNKTLVRENTSVTRELQKMKSTLSGLFN